MFALIEFIILFLLFLSIYYIVKKIYYIEFFDCIKNKYLRVIISILLLVPLFISMSITNAIVVYIHFGIFLVISDIIFNILNKKRKKKDRFKNSIIVLTAFGITAFVMLIAVFLNFHVWETHYKVYTDKNIGTDNLRVVQISDSHIGTTFNGKDLKKYVDRINKTNPDIVVITGDFIDDATSKEDMIDACKSLSYLKSTYGTYFVYGNHDQGYNVNFEIKSSDLEEELAKNNVTVLADEVIEINDYIYIIGRKDRRMVRETIDSLTNDLNKDRYMIDLNHQPNDYDNESKAKVDLVLSGHTHGGQLFPLGYIGVLFKANDGFYGLSKRDNTTFIINSGISDWEIYFKTGTKSEYVVIDIVNK